MRSLGNSAEGKAGRVDHGLSDVPEEEPLDRFAVVPEHGGHVVVANFLIGRLFDHQLGQPGGRGLQGRPGSAPESSKGNLLSHPQSLPVYQLLLLEG